MIHKHVLKGCSPTPLAHYLKALGILRLVAEQKDPACRGAWIDDHFVLATKLNREELERFFLDEYEPTAFVAPWNKGSGFFQTNDPGLSPIEKSISKRLSKFRDGIIAARSLLGEMETVDAKVRSIKDSAKIIKNAIDREAFKKSEEYKISLAAADRAFKTLKADLLPNCRLEWRASHLEWMASAMVLDEDGKPKFPSLLGTGGNDGRLDFTNNCMQRLGEVIDLSDSLGRSFPSAVPQLHNSLWATTTKDLMKGVAIGQYLPGNAGGANSTTGPDGSSLVNPWDFILMLEGALILSSAATKRLNSQSQVQASAPFALYNQAIGIEATSEAEESQRGEQWMPLWGNYFSLGEVKNLFAEGRTQIGKVTASRPVDMVRAISKLGVARGISAFQRFGYLQRNGLSNFAIPLERVAVVNRPKSRLIDEIAPWLDRLHRAARDKGAPARLVHVERNLADAVFAALTHDDSPTRWQAILLAAVEVEKIQATGTAIKIGPIPSLSPGWVLACTDNSAGPEERLAVALGSSAGIRHYCLPLDSFGGRFATTDQGKRLVHDVRVVVHGRSPEMDLIQILQRRTIESANNQKRHPALASAQGTEAHLADISAWISGEVDRERCVNLARAFMAVDWVRWTREGHRVPAPEHRDFPDDAWCALKLNALPWALDAERDIPFDPAILRRLESGDGNDSLRLALRRLLAHGIRPAFTEGFIDSALSISWGSALVFPISKASANQILNRIQQTTKETRNVH